MADVQVSKQHHYNLLVKTWEKRYHSDEGFYPRTVKHSPVFVGEVKLSATPKATSFSHINIPRGNLVYLQSYHS